MSEIERETMDYDVVIVGAGPAGLECAMQLAKRGYDVTLAEAREDQHRFPGAGAEMPEKFPVLSRNSWAELQGHARR